MADGTERWRVIAGYDHCYEVSSLGRVRSRKQAAAGKLLKQSPLPRGYLRVFLSRFGKVDTRYVHELVLETFVEPRPASPPGCKRMEARHLDGNPANNDLTNLAWGTSSENKQDLVRHGLLKRLAARAIYSARV